MKKCTLRKVWNFLKLVISFYLSKWSKKPIHWGFPVAVAIEPTTACNLRCPECPSGLRAFTRPTGMLSESLLYQIIDELQDVLLYLTFYFQGEPYLNPRFLEMVSYATQRNIYTITSTNGHYLTDEIAQRTVLSSLDCLIISIDGVTQETYQSYRKGGSLQKVIEGTKNIVKWKKLLKSSVPHVVFQFLVVKPNEHEIPQVYQLAHQLGVDEVRLKTAQIYDYQNGSELIPTISQYSRYALGNDGKYYIKNRLTHSCWKMWHSCVITWDGKVVPCCFDKDAHHTLGQLSAEQSLKKVWKSQEYRSFRSKILQSRSNIEMCQNCTEGTKVWN
ncbi:MAG: SPASM domain-containing protein [Cytophagales bacterium]|nr:SPASM domain-containing protein [Cytophagales bacterium]MDW8383710.1 radical SAM/SPASM domain-containing protein [Flammeovirgaceae bacterium]